MKNLFILFLGIFLVFPALAQRLDVVTFASSEKSGFVNCYILPSGKKSILVDAPMSVKDAHRLIDTIIRLNRHISGLFITTASPYHLLGVSEIKKAFPSIRIMAVHEVAEEIEKTGPRNYAYFKPAMGTDMPEKLIMPDSIVENSLTLENCRLEVHSLQDGESFVTSILYEPKQQLLFSSDIVNNKVHLNMVSARLDGWIKELEELKKYSVYELYPGYGEPAKAGSLDICINYIQTFQQALITNDPVAVFDIMQFYFPDYLSPGKLKAAIGKFMVGTEKVLKH